jgi:hypothetical protein
MLPTMADGSRHWLDAYLSYLRLIVLQSFGAEVAMEHTKIGRHMVGY